MDSFRRGGLKPEMAVNNEYVWNTVPAEGTGGTEGLRPGAATEFEGDRQHAIRMKISDMRVLNSHTPTRKDDKNK